ncbi:MAG: hypothetical protein SGCHY_001843 [Lobulomycetales sp.]
MSLANLVSTVAYGAKGFLSVATLLTGALLQTSRETARFSVNLFRTALMAALGSAISESEAQQLASAGQRRDGMFNRVLTHYTHLSIGITMHGCSLLDLLLCTSFHLADRSIQLSFSACEGLVDAIDGIFGSNESSKALSAFAQLVYEEMISETVEDVDKLGLVGHVSAVASLSKALVAYSCLLSMTSNAPEPEKTVLFSGLIHETPQKLGGFPTLESTSESDDLLLEFCQDNGSSHPVLVKWFSETGNVTRIEVHETDVDSLLSATVSDIEGQPEAAFPTDVDDDTGSELSVLSDFAKTIRVGKRLSHASLKEALEIDEINSLQMRRRKKSKDSLLNQNAVRGSHFSDGKSQMTFDSTISSHKDANTGLRKRVSVIRMKPRPAATLSSSSTTRLKQLDESTTPKDLAVLIRDLRKYMRIATASYGKQFMQLFGLSHVKSLSTRDTTHPADHYTFAIHSGLPLNSIVYSSCKTPSASGVPVHAFIAVDHAAENVIVAIRGTLGLSDLLVDVACRYKGMSVDGADKEYSVHAGMLDAALEFSRHDSEFFKALVGALSANPGFGVVLVGHSLGAGVCSLLSLLWSRKRASTGGFVTNRVCGLSANRSLHCFAFGSPCVIEESLVPRTIGLITCLVNGDDVVSQVSLGSIRDLRNICRVILANRGLAEQIIGKSLSSQSISQGEKLWMDKLANDLAMECDNEKLVIPGTIYHMSCHASTILTNGDVKLSTQRLELSKSTRSGSFKRLPIKFGAGLISDHSPASYEEALEILAKAENKG